MKFYRVGNTKTNQGLWYDMQGNFTGLIHNVFSFCKNKDLPMPYDKSIVGYLSATKTLEELYFWFDKKDIDNLKKYGYEILVYESEDYRFHNNHWVIHKNSKLIGVLS